MARKPYFRAFNGWRYAQVQVAAKRKQIKLIKGKENEQEAYRAFCRDIADHEGKAPKPRPRPWPLSAISFSTTAKSTTSPTRSSFTAL
jgi:hypothetical protein